MSATDIEIELNEFEKSDSTLQNTTSFDSQNQSSTSCEQKEDVKPPINSDYSLGVGLKKYDIDKYYRVGQPSIDHLLGTTCLYFCRSHVIDSPETPHKFINRNPNSFCILNDIGQGIYYMKFKETTCSKCICCCIGNTCTHMDIHQFDCTGERIARLNRPKRFAWPWIPTGLRRADLYAKIGNHFVC
ncbi:unnamed protein product [Oikopleura dioica]|uniref:Phospholipid scramblase n=1 Tax=Oikopleura dioica TaxID=34765 RepID=E4XTJ8_OIKDI|nr:unnamed protein product [Oikopleura dioica]